MDLEKKLDKGIQDWVKMGPADLAPEDWAVMREHYRLPVLYAGKFVAYRNHYRGEWDLLRLVRCEVLATARSLGALHKRIAALPKSQQKDIQVTYVEKTSDTIRV